LILRPLIIQEEAEDFSAYGRFESGGETIDMKAVNEYY
jgi:hypothetical protein